MTTTGWFVTTRAVLELLYYVAGIAIAVAAFWGLKQLRISKQIARTSAKREAIKFAAERCQYFADHTVEMASQFTAEYRRLGLQFLSKELQFVVHKGEITKHNFDERLLDTEIPRISKCYVGYMNTMEAFAIPFAAGVADDKLGFQETAHAFVQGVQMCMPGIFHQRKHNGPRYESTVRLYEHWNSQLAAQRLAPVMKSMEEIIKAAEKGSIKTLDVEF